MGDIDQILDRYRQKLTAVAELWSWLFARGHGDVTTAKQCQEEIKGMEIAVRSLLENRIRMAQKRQQALDLKQDIAISRLAVDAKSKHLDQEEEERAEERQSKFEKLQAARKLESEKADFEMKVANDRKKLVSVLGAIDDKSERLRHLEEFHEWLVEFSASDIETIRQQTERGRLETSDWDRHDFNVFEKIRANPIKADELCALRETVKRLSSTVQNYRDWYDEELQTKLFYWSRNNEMKKKSDNLLATLQQLEKKTRPQGRVLKTCSDDTVVQTNLENLLVDGFGSSLAGNMQEYLVKQFGGRLISDCVVTSRFKDLLSDMSLAYLLDSTRNRPPHQEPDMFLTRGNGAMDDGSPKDHSQPDADGTLGGSNEYIARGPDPNAFQSAVSALTVRPVVKVAHRFKVDTAPETRYASGLATARNKRPLARFRKFFKF